MLRFTSEFGMDSGGSTALWSSSKLAWLCSSYTPDWDCELLPNKVGYMSGDSLRTDRVDSIFACSPEQVWVLYGQASRAISIS